MITGTAHTNQELKKVISNECNFSGKRITKINGISLIDRNDLPNLEVSNKHCTLRTYAPFLGHKTIFLDAPFTYEIQ